MTGPSGPKIGECATWLSIVSQLYTTRMNALLAPHDLTLAQFGILHHIVRPENSGGSRISDIAAAVEVGQPAVTKAIAKFRTLGLVVLDESPGDKRSRIVRPTPLANQRLTEIRKSIGPDLGQMFGAMDQADFAIFAKSLKRLGMWLDQNRLP